MDAQTAALAAGIWIGPAILAWWLTRQRSLSERLVAVAVTLVGWLLGLLLVAVRSSRAPRRAVAAFEQSRLTAFVAEHPLLYAIGALAGIGLLLVAAVTVGAWFWLPAVVLLFTAHLPYVYAAAQDMDRRGRNGLAWMYIVFIGGWLGLVVWRLARRLSETQHHVNRSA